MLLPKMFATIFLLFLSLALLVSEKFAGHKGEQDGSGHSNITGFDNEVADGWMPANKDAQKCVKVIY